MRAAACAGGGERAASGVRGAAAAGRDALSRAGLAEFCSVAALDGGVAPSQGRTPSCARDVNPRPSAASPHNKSPRRSTVTLHELYSSLSTKYITKLILE